MSSGTILYDWTKSESEIIVDMIRADTQDRPLTPAWVSFGIPEELIPDVETYNTRVLVAATINAPFVGQQYHRYHRVDINDFAELNYSDLVFVIEDIPTLASFAVALSERLGINLTVDKIDFTLPTAEGVYSVTVRPESLCYIGVLEVEFKWRVKPLPEFIPNLDLIGFQL